MSKSFALVSCDKDMLKLLEQYGIVVLWEQGADEPKSATPQPPERTVVDVTINSLSDSPSIQFEVGDTNMIAVDDFEYIDGACATQNVTLLGRTILMNICDNGDGPSIKLDVEFDGKFLKQVPFKLNRDGRNVISQ